MSSEVEIIKVRGKKVKAGKNQHFVVGQVYELPKWKADLVISNGQAELATEKKKAPAKAKSSKK